MSEMDINLSELKKKAEKALEKPLEPRQYQRFPIGDPTTILTMIQGLEDARDLMDKFRCECNCVDNSCVWMGESRANDTCQLDEMITRLSSMFKGE